jgi:hypothetical protein
VRKASGATFIALCALIPLCAWADTARDNVVNPGNAVHLGAIEAPGAIANTEDADSAREASSAQDSTDSFINEAACACQDSECDICQPSCSTFEFFGPLAVINQHPPSVLFLSPVPEPATIVAPGQRFLRLKLDWTNLIIRELDSGVIADYDFEMLRAEANYSTRLGRGELSARLPVVYRGQGMLDGIIADWHNTFGLLNGLRDNFPDGMYRYTIATRDGLVFNDEGDSFGLGDLAVAYKHPLWNRGDGRDAAALRMAVKVPLGDPNTAMGSGNWDVQLGALYQRQLSRKLRGYANVDWVFTGAPDWENISHQDILATLWAVEYAWKQRTTIVLEYRTQRNPLRIGSYEADKDSQDLAVGFNHRVNDSLVWSGGFAEDINPETSPDLLLFSYLAWEQ